MTKRLKSLSFIATVAIAMITWGSLLQAQQSSPDTQKPSPQSQPAPQSQNPPDTQAPPQTPDQAQQADPSGGKEFVGTVVKQGDKYMFQEASTGTMYNIDHQDEVKKFEGKKVRVHGTLDPNGKMIHVQ